MENSAPCLNTGYLDDYRALTKTGRPSPCACVCAWHVHARKQPAGGASADAARMKMGSVDKEQRSSSSSSSVVDHKETRPTRHSLCAESLRLCLSSSHSTTHL